MTTTLLEAAGTQAGAGAQEVGALIVVPFAHPQGCRSYLVADPASGQALAIDPHLDLVQTMTTRVEAEGWTLPYVLDTHTHADHPSGAGALAQRFRSTRLGHALGRHTGVTRHPADGEDLHLGDVPLTVRHVPGHTPDHLVVLADELLFSGDSLFIGGVARTDFLSGDAGTLHDNLQRLLVDLPDETRLFPGHDYAGRISSTLGDERRHNPWLAIQDRQAFVEALSANPPPRPANMDLLLRLNREGVAIPEAMSAQEAAAFVKGGGAGSVVDVRTEAEVAAEHVPGSLAVPLDRIDERVEAVAAVPAPRLLLCQSGARAQMAAKSLAAHGLGGLTVVRGGIAAFRQAGGLTVKGEGVMSLERQVRIAAGALVVLGVLLGYALHGGFFVLSGLVGAGLVFAGVTDRCGMALLLARMPWNRAATGAAGSAAAAGGCAASLPPPGTCAAGPPSATQGGGCAAGPPPARQD